MYLVTWRWPGQKSERTTHFLSQRDVNGVRDYWMLNGFGREVLSIRKVVA